MADQVHDRDRNRGYEQETYRYASDPTGVLPRTGHAMFTPCLLLCLQFRNATLGSGGTRFGFSDL